MPRAPKAFLVKVAVSGLAVIGVYVMIASARHERAVPERPGIDKGNFFSHGPTIRFPQLRLSTGVKQRPRWTRDGGNGGVSGSRD